MAAYDIDTWRRYGRITRTMADDQECMLYLEAAVAALTAQGVQSDRLKGDRMYELTIYMLALYYYDNRGSGDVGAIPASLLSVVNLLHYTPEEGSA